MADEAATAQDGQFMLISILPDVCITNGCPVPYPITHTMDKSGQCSPNVFFRGKAAFLHNESFVDFVSGDEPGTGKGVVSGTNMGISHSIEKSASVFINGKPLVRTGDKVWMNTKKPPDGRSAVTDKKQELANLTVTVVYKPVTGPVENARVTIKGPALSR
jgi:hypothetical protein